MRERWSRSYVAAGSDHPRHNDSSPVRMNGSRAVDEDPLVVADAVLNGMDQAVGHSPTRQWLRRRRWLPTSEYVFVKQRW